MTVSWRSYLEAPVLPIFGKSFSLRPLNFNSPLRCASSRILSKLLVSCFWMWQLIFVVTIAILHFSSTKKKRHARPRKLFYHPNSSLFTDEEPSFCDKSASALYCLLHHDWCYLHDSHKMMYIHIHNKKKTELYYILLSALTQHCSQLWCSPSVNEKWNLVSSTFCRKFWRENSKCSKLILSNFSII